MSSTELQSHDTEATTMMWAFIHSERHEGHRVSSSQFEQQSAMSFPFVKQKQHHEVSPLEFVSVIPSVQSDSCMSLPFSLPPTFRA